MQIKPRQQNSYSFGAEQKTDEYALIADRLAENACGLKFGEISVVCTIHNGRIAKKTFSRTEQTRDVEK